MVSASEKAGKDNRIVWMDLEMTGLDPVSDTILEIATIITDNQLRVVATGPTMAIHHPDTTWERMDDWNRKHHSASGLWDRVLQSTTSLEEAEKLTLDFICAHTVQGKAPLAGNSVWQDRRFLIKYMPRVEQHLNYRLIDVSTVKELVSRLGLKVAKFEKKNRHLAMEDILESIEELKYYVANALKLPPELAEEWNSTM